VNFYDQIKAVIKPDDRIIMAKKDILPTKFPVAQDHNEYDNSGKPLGLWYGIGTDWLKWVEAEMPHWRGKHFYKVYITGRVLRITNKNELLEFVGKYRIRAKDNPKHRQYSYLLDIPKNYEIDWKKVASRYSGIEISPYQWEFRHKFIWYYSWDVASGCIWRRNGLSKITRLNIE
jgi:hypothetical protein